MDDRRLSVAIGLPFPWIHGRIATVVHAKARSGHIGAETQHVVVHPAGKTGRGFTTPAELRRAHVECRLAHQEVVLDVHRVQPLFGDRIADHGHIITFPQPGFGGHGCCDGSQRQDQRGEKRGEKSHGFSLTRVVAGGFEVGESNGT